MSEETESGLYLYGVTRARGWRGSERRNTELQHIRYRDIEAIVRPAAFELPSDHDAALTEHQRVLEALMRRYTILPTPVGIIFKGRRALIRWLQDQYLVLDEGLSLLDGHWELRMHVTGAAVGDDETRLSDDAMAVYSELRRFARAAVPFPSENGRLASAAFLVDRTSWVEFVERIEDFNAHHKELSFEITGPWPAYDFVRVVT